MQNLEEAQMVGKEQVCGWEPVVGIEVQLSANKCWPGVYTAYVLGHKDAEILTSSQLPVLEQETEEDLEKEGWGHEGSQCGAESQDSVDSAQNATRTFNGVGIMVAADKISALDGRWHWKAPESPSTSKSYYSMSRLGGEGMAQRTPPITPSEALLPLEETDVPSSVGISHPPVTVSAMTVSILMMADT